MGKFQKALLQRELGVAAQLLIPKNCGSVVGVRDLAEINDWLPPKLEFVGFNEYLPLD